MIGWRRTGWPGLLAGLALGFAVPAAALAPEPSHQVAARGTIEVVFSPWADGEAALLKAIDDARELILVQAYLFTSKPLARGLAAARRRGVRVEVIVDADSNRQATSGVVPELLAAGIPVYADDQHNIAHSKVMIFDPASSRAAVATGSYNFTRSARVRNAENLLILRGNPPLVRVYHANWRRHRAEARRIASVADLPGRKRKQDGRKPDRSPAD